MEPLERFALALAFATLSAILLAPLASLAFFRPSGSVKARGAVTSLSIFTALGVCQAANPFHQAIARFVEFRILLTVAARLLITA